MVVSEIKQTKKHDKKWLIIFIVVGSVTIIGSAISNFGKKTNQQPTMNRSTTNQENITNNWGSIAPGDKLNSETKKKLGKPITTKNTETGKEYGYRSAFPAYNNTVTASNNTIEFIKEYLVYSASHTLDKYIDIFGEPQLTMNVPSVGGSVKAYIFLDDGLVVIAHTTDNSIQQKWYFKPTTREKFLKSWGSELSLKELDPGPF